MWSLIGFFSLLLQKLISQRLREPLDFRFCEDIFLADFGGKLESLTLLRTISVICWQNSPKICLYRNCSCITSKRSTKLTKVAYESYWAYLSFLTNTSSEIMSYFSARGELAQKPLNVTLNRCYKTRFPSSDFFSAHTESLISAT